MKNFTPCLKQHPIHFLTQNFIFDVLMQKIISVKRQHLKIYLLLTLSTIIFAGKIIAQYTTSAPTIDAATTIETAYANNYTGGGATYAVTWDATYLYVLVKNAKETEPVSFAIDWNPIVPINGGSNTNGTNIYLTGRDGITPTAPNLPFRADAIVYAHNSYRELFRSNGSNGWTSITGTNAPGSNGLTGSIDDYTGDGNGKYASNQNGNGASGDDVRELKISWDRLRGTSGGTNMPTSFNFLAFVSYSNGMYAQIPLENYGSNAVNSNLNGIVRYFTVSNTSNGSSTASFSQNSYTHPFGVTNNSFGAINVYDFTMNSTGQQISRLNTGGDWTIGGNLVVGAGTVFFGSGGTGYGTSTVANVNVAGGTLNMDQTTKSLNVSGNVLNTGTITLSGQIGGDLVVQGNLTDNGTFNANNRAVFFSGTNVQDLQGSGVFDIAYVRINKSAGRVRMLSNLTCQGPNGGNAMELNSATSILDLNGFTLNLGQDGGTSTFNNLVGTPGFIRGSSTSTLNILGVGALGTISFETGNQTLGTLSVDRTSSGSATLGSPLTVATALTVTSGTSLNNGGNNLTVSSAGSTSAAGIIAGSGALIKTAAGTLTLSAASGNNTTNTYAGGTTINSGGSGTISVTGLSNITSTSIASATQSVTFSTATPANGNYQLLPGALTVGTQSFSSNAATSKAATLNYANSTVTVATSALNAVTLTSALSNTYGTASTPGIAFTASGTLSPGVTIIATPNAGYEVSVTSATSGFQNTAISSIANGATVWVRNAATKNAGTYNTTAAVVLSSSGVSSANVTTAASGNTVSQSALTITGLTGVNKAYDGTTSATASGTAAYSGLQNGETFGSVSGTPTFTFASASVANGISISTTGYTAPSSNYSLSQPTISANITARGLTITGLTGVNKAYDGTTSATASGTAAYSGLQNSESFNVSGTPVFTFASANVGTGISISISGFTVPNGNYTLTQPTLSANITTASSSITATGTTSFTYSGSAQGPTTSTVTGSTGTVTYSYSGTGGTNYAASATRPTNAGTYQVIATVAADANYATAISAALAFTIAPATATITVTVGTYAYSVSEQGPTAVTGNTGSGTVTWSYAGTVGTSYTASATKPTAAGTYTATASVTANGNYASASSSATSFSITKATPTIISSPTATPITFGQDLTASSLSGIASADGSFVFTTPATAPGIGTASQAVTFLPTDAANYNSFTTTASVTVNGVAYTEANFRSNGNVNFTSNTNWQYDEGSNNWVAAGTGVFPSSTNNVTIRNGHTATLNQNFTVGTGKSLILNSTSALTITATSRLEMTDNTSTIDFGDQSVTLKSTISGTGAIGKITGTLSGASNVTIERYIPSNGFRSWRLLSVPTFGSQTIAASWQLNTLITGTGSGFDAGGASMLTYDPSGNSWSSVAGTNLPIGTPDGYFLYVRGDRSQGTAGANNVTNATTLSTTGTLYQGNNGTSIPAGKYGLVGNLYPSAIDFTKLTKSSSIGNVFYLWDSKKLFGTSLGVYQYFDASLGYKCLISGGSFSTATGNTTIQSGQAFFVHNSSLTSGSVTLNEDSKVSSSGASGFRPATPANAIATIYSRLLDASGSNVGDVNVVKIDNSFSNEIDGNDIAKMSNGGENFGIQRAGKTFAIEGRQPISENDTIFYNMWNMQKQSYKLEFEANNLAASGLTASLQDSYLNSNTPVDLLATTRVNFTVDANAASSAANRFRLVFKPSIVLPVSFISISASRGATGATVNWKVAAERAVNKYEVERSTNGRSFSTAGTVASSGLSNYSFADANASAGTLFYRIKMVGMAGEISYSGIVKLSAGNIKPGFSVSPNPVEGSTVNLQLMNQAAGSYNIRLISVTGQLVFNSIALHTGGSSTQVLNMPAGVARGAYQLEIIAPDKTKMVQKLMINTNK